MKSNSKYEIQFSGLSNGLHEFDWTLEPTFFDEENLAEISESNLRVFVTLNKTDRMLTLDFTITGKMKCICDRCADEFWMEIQSTQQLIARFAPETNLMGDEVVFLSPAEYQIDVRQFIYEFVLLSLPAKKTHPAGKCDSQVLEYLSENEETENIEKDPRWNALEKLKKEE